MVEEGRSHAAAAWVAAIAGLAGVGVTLVVWLDSRDAEHASGELESTTPSVPPTDSQTSDPRQTIAPDGAAHVVELAGEESWTGVLEVVALTPVFFDVVADADDLALTVDGQYLHEFSDDRGEFLDYGLAMGIDPVLGATLDAGDYEVAVRTADGDPAAGGFAMTVHAPGLLTLGEVVPVETSGASPWIGAVVLSETTDIVIDTVSTQGDPILGLLHADGTTQRVDDAEGGAGYATDPYLEVSLPAGVHFLTLHELNDNPMTFELLVVAA